MPLENYLQTREHGQISIGGEKLILEFCKDWLGTLLFVIYINDLPDRITSTCKIFANDISS